MKGRRKAYNIMNLIICVRLTIGLLYNCVNKNAKNYIHIQDELNPFSARY